jgi:hypothetical protein
MTPPLTVWQCDTCGDNITQPGKGLVVWRTDDDHRDYDFRIVHMNMDGRSCDPGADRGFLFVHLSRFLGDDGLVRELSLLRPVDYNGFVDLVMRTQIPWFEEARPYLQTEHTQDWLGDARQFYPCTPDVLKRIAEQELE